MKLPSFATILLGSALPCVADFVVDQNLGVLPTGNTVVSGSTAGAPDNSVFIRGVNLNAAANWGGERVFQFELTAPSVINISHDAVFTGDPDFFLVSSLTTSIDPGTGKLSGEDGVGSAFLDNPPPASEAFPLLTAGIYYLVVESFSGFDGAVNHTDASFTVTLTVVDQGDDPMSLAIDLGQIVAPNTPFAIDTLGSGFDTELAVFDGAGGLLATNDDVAAGTFHSILNFAAGLPVGDYYIVIAGYNTAFASPFGVSTGGETGSWTLNHPGGQELGATDPSSVGTAIQYFTFSVVGTDPIDYAIDLGHIARSDSPFAIDTFGSAFDTEIGLYDAFGGLLDDNDDAAGGLQSQLDFPAGLPAGDYYLVLAGFESTFANAFGVISAGGQTGDWTLNYPQGPTFGAGLQTGTTTPGSPVTEQQYFSFSIGEAPASFSDLGTLAAADIPFMVDTFGSLFDTELGVYDSEGFFLGENDDAAGTLQSQLDFNIGLPEGEYFIALGGYNTGFGDGFVTVVNGGAEGGEYLLNHPLGSADGVLPANTRTWFTFAVGPFMPGTDEINITSIDYNPATFEFTVAWQSTAAGPFDIWVGTGSDLSGVDPAPNNLLPSLGAIGVTSPAVFLVPAILRGQPQLFLQVAN